MILLWLAAFIVPSEHARYLDRVPEWPAYLKHCNMTSSKIRSKFENPRSWFATVHNGVTNTTYNAAFISESHLVTVKQAVTVIDEVTGIERMVDVSQLGVSHINLDGSYPVAHALLPVEYDEQTAETSLLHLAIIQIKTPLPKKIVYLCHHRNEDFNNKNNSMVSVFLDAERKSTTSNAFQPAKTSPCTSYECMRFIYAEESASPRSAQWVLTGDVERLVGVAVNETAAIRLIHWEPFICAHTGACLNKATRNAAERLNRQPYMIDGQLFLEPCTGAYRRKMMKEITVFNRLTKEEANQVQETCGKPSDELVQFFVLLQSSDETCDGGKSNACKWGTCSGALISNRHIITTAKCLQNLDLESVDNLTSKAYVAYMTRKHSVITRKGPTVETLTGQLAVKFGRIAFYKQIGLIELAEPLDDSLLMRARPICLPTVNDPLPVSLDMFDLRLVDRGDNYSMQVRTFEQYKWHNIYADTVNASISNECRQRLHLINSALKESEKRMYFDECGEFIIHGAPKDDEYSGILYSTVTGRRVLYGVTSDSGDDKSVDISVFARWICLHTGLCEDGDAFRPFHFNDSEVPPDHFSEMGNLLTPPYTREPALRWRDIRRRKGVGIFMTVIMNQLHTISYMDWNPSRRLSAIEYKKTKETCGSKGLHNIAYPWQVLIGSVSYDGKNRQSFCTGSFISQRHVITSTKCIFDPREGRYTGNRMPDVFMRTSKDGSLEDHKVLAISNILYAERFQAGDDAAIDVAVLELEEDVIPSEFHSMLCLPERGDEYYYNVDAKARQTERLYWSGGHTAVDVRIEHQERQPMGGLKRIVDGQIGYGSTVQDDRDYEERELIFEVEGRKEGSDIPYKELDRGSPWVIERENPDRRYVLYGIHSGSKYNGLPYYTKVEKITRLICRMTGVCPTPPYEDDINVEEKDIHVDGHKICV